MLATFSLLKCRAPISDPQLAVFYAADLIHGVVEARTPRIFFGELHSTLVNRLIVSSRLVSFGLQSGIVAP